MSRFIDWDQIESPPPQVFKHREWFDGFGSDFYGAFHVAAAYCGLSEPPARFPGVWQHGAVPHWQQVQPEVVIYGAPHEVRCWVARKDEATYLRAGGYNRTEAIGLPFAYVPPSSAHRVPRSLLIVPTHAIPGDGGATDDAEYVARIARQISRFDVVAACVAGRCIDQGLWINHFEKLGIKVLRGASIEDANSLARLRTMFDTFECVTTSGYGSHVAYALFCGARVSLWGPTDLWTVERLMRDGVWRQYPDAARQFVAAQTEAEKMLAPFRVEPAEALANREYGTWLVGAENKLPPRALCQAFGWTTTGRSLFAIKQRLERTNMRFFFSKGRQTRK